MSSRRDFPSADEAEAKAQRGLDEVKAKAQQGADDAKARAQQGAEKARIRAQEGKEKVENKLAEDGVENPAGLSMFAFGGIFLAAIPLTSWVTQPNSLVEKAVNGVVSTVGFLSSAGSTSTVTQNGKLAALAGLYVTVTYALSGAGSAAGVAAGNKEGRDNEHPRAQVKNLRGLPLRLHSAHYNLMEMFPGFALTAALAQAMAPGDQTLINLLGLHVIAKCFVHYPCYVFNLGTPRTLAHVIATSSVINVALRLAKKPI